MPQTQDTDETPTLVSGFDPITADLHVSGLVRTGSVVPERRSIWPLAPWRWVLLAVAIFLAATCGPAAAAPVWNGADLAVLISLAILVAAFTPGRD